MSKLFGWFRKNKQPEKEQSEVKPQESIAVETPATEVPVPAQSNVEAEAPAEETKPEEAVQNESVAEAKVVEPVEPQVILQAQPKSTAAEQPEPDVPAFDEPVEPSLRKTGPEDASGPGWVESEKVTQQVKQDEVQSEVVTDEDITPEEITPVVAAVPVPESELEQEPVSEPELEVEAEPEPVIEAKPEPKEEKKSLFSRLKASLSRTKANLGSGFVSLFRGKAIDDDLYEELETQLLVADVGMDTTQKIINKLTDSAKRSQLKDAEALVDILKGQMRDMLKSVERPLVEDMKNHDASTGPYVILMVGVNGVGKTTTIGKLAKQFQQQGKKVMLAAGDTFRAAAVEQLQVWGERNKIPVIAQPTGSDSASVLYDALEAAKSRGTDILIADTAGRLQNKNNLMEELKKVVRVMKKLSPNAPHEVMLTLDAGTGQNAVSQAKLFNEAVGLTGLTLTKLDGTAKGGVIFSIADQFGIPIRYIGVGEGIDDLRTFNGDEFIDALFSETEND
ncbi:signal recognition particle-docking protein FtsY [Alteromonas confluentis]|uniref:Signal recognition particle receptor FtsY n=1 Tax=Alteromonas confluentis TaxID=1656094 RepID=A0A1E7Z982_9ALTE|nr:signal recognition particle-docking protein FtsY [Alteromonas confluentis]OFC69964.1 signal recognition particle-docking protein FtsY [Alteromonas confluentis]